MLLTVLVFLVILSILVLVHELGHFVVAKKLGIKVEEFGFGLPPRVLGKRIGETVYSLNALPIGGFVRLYGEESDLAEAWPDKGEAKRAFYARPAWQRSLVLVSGVTMNFLLALVILSFIFTQGVFVPATRVHIEKVASGTPAEAAGLLANDIIAAIDNQPINKSEQLIILTKERLGGTVSLTIWRGANFAKPIRESQCPSCQKLTVSLTPRRETPEGEGPIGISISDYELRLYPWYQAPIQGMRESLVLSWELVRGISRTLLKLATFQSVSQEVAGPLGIAQVTGEAVKFGKLAVVELLGLLSLNLAIINILPFPALDGGRLLFVAIEALFGKRIKMHWEKTLHQVGMAILLALILLVTVNDILRILGKV